MNPAPAKLLDQFVVAFAGVDHLLAYIKTHLPDNPKDVPFRGGRLRADYEVRPSQTVEMGGVISHKEGHVDQLADPLCSRQAVHTVGRIHRLDCRHMVGFRADAADTVGDVRHLFGMAAHTE